MSLINTFVYTRTVIDWDKMAEALHNQFRVVSSRLYADKKGILPEGVTLTLTVLKDDFDYGIDKKNGKPRENNLYQNFDVTVLNRNHDFKKGDVIRLIGFDAENSFAIGYDLLMRFKDAELIQQQGVKPHA